MAPSRFSPTFAAPECCTARRHARAAVHRRRYRTLDDALGTLEAAEAVLESLIAAAFASLTLPEHLLGIPSPRHLVTSPIPIRAKSLTHGRNKDNE